MQAQVTVGATRRSLDLEDYADFLGRHKGWIVGPLFAVVVLAVVGSYLWPDTYQSKASLKIVSPVLDPRISGGSPLNAQLSDRLSAMASTILSRVVLQTIIQQNDLYPKELRHVPIEDAVENMRREILISPAHTIAAANGQASFSAFTIQFSYPDRFKAQKVVSDLVGRFIVENQKAKTSGMLSGLRMLQDRMDHSQQELDRAETKLAAFRAANQGRLPEQQVSATQQLVALQTRLSLIHSSLSRASQDRMMLQTNLGLEREKGRAFVEAPQEQTAAVRSERAVAIEREMQRYEDLVSALRESVTDKHPDLVAAQQRLAALAKQHDLLIRKESSSSVVRKDPAARRVAQEYEGNVKRYETQLASKELEIESLNKESREVSSQIRELSGRMQGMPLSEKEYAELQRERDSAKEKYREAGASLSRMQSGHEVENHLLGEGLEQLDAPLLPQTPSEPKRPAIIAVGALLGLLIGLVTAGAREFRDQTLKNLKDAQAYTKATILASVPLLENEIVVRRRRRIAWLGWTAGILVGTALMAASVASYYITRA